MQLESHATPPRETPQQRYANLHRAIERGLDSDEVWKELAEVSLIIGHGDEAVRCMRRIRNETTRFVLEKRLSRLGLTPVPVPPADAAHDAAPAASHAGTGRANHGDDHSLRDHVVDAFQYLFHQQMPWLVLVTTLAFPLVVGVGGFLTAGGSPLLLTAIAALPGLCVMATVGAMGRHILLASAEGNGDVPPVPGFGDLIQSAKHFFADAGLVLGALLGPSLLALWLGAPLSTSLPGLAIGAFFVPMAWALRHLRADFDALSPVVLLRAVARGGLSYAGVAAVACAMFLPAAGVAWIAFGRPVWVQIASIGPLCVLPLFLTSRLLGTWLDSHRSAIASVRPARAPAAKAAAAKAPAPAATPRPATANAQAPRQPRRPQALEHFRAPVVSRIHAPAAAARTHAAAVDPAPAAPAAPAKTAPRSIEGRSPAPRSQEPAATTHPSGRVVVTGNDRKRLGAAAKRQ